MNEHRKEAEQNEEKRFTRSTKQAAEANIKKSAITDHVHIKNHIIDWEESKVVAKESDRFTRWILESVVIRKTGNKAMNRDIGTNNLSHTYDSLLVSAESSSEKSRSMVRKDNRCCRNVTNNKSKFCCIEGTLA